MSFQDLNGNAPRVFTNKYRSFLCDGYALSSFSVMFFPDLIYTFKLLFV